MFQQSTQHVASYYAHTCTDRLVDRAALEGEQDTDVVIIGAGFSGLHTALRLALAGKRVTVLEASRVAWAASGRNGGQAILGWSCDMPPLEAALGYERARRLWDGMRWAARELRDLPGRHGFDCDYRPGHLWTSVMPRRVSLLTEWQHEASHKWGHDGLQFVERRDLPKWVASERYQAGLFDPEGGHLNPLKLALGLADAIEQAGGRIHELSKALSYREEGDGFVVTTERGRIRADVLVLACNAYLDQLDPQLSSCVLPVGTYQVATAPLAKELVTALLPSNVCVTDNQFVLDYFRRTPDNRLLFGGGCTYLGGMPKDIAAATRPFLERVFPQLTDVELEFAWGGHIDLTLKRTPDLGRRGELYWMQGYSGHGVLPTLAGARAICDAILGQPDELSLYQGLSNGSFPGGKYFAAPLEAIGKAWYRLRDSI
ncbi:MULTISPECIES: NAD(P)/FAD-dependent oxidoreductase [unclassified Pseudomonas]|jgi:glycine/D-amino acid oxidase-like deaminating enzyme|uniref:NAD(P)/FAD-dependent oxidoreductase n=1 Tax=unclassified Pseudomonas TaxID=196821 RepID=UPI00069E329B|nr:MULTISPECIES: FAD-binding oxidoreductase [unclassified Pseudomonas]WPN49253.1 FAD-binding oxidoreductase [Pseudomonas sp. P8_241]